VGEFQCQSKQMKTGKREMRIKAMGETKKVRKARDNAVKSLRGAGRDQPGMTRQKLRKEKVANNK